MTTIAYLYIDPLLESVAATYNWQREVDRVYQDFGQRIELQKAIAHCQDNPPEYLLLRRIEELGDTVTEICDRLKRLESLGVDVIANEQYQSSAWQHREIGQIKADLSEILHKVTTNKRVERLKQGHARNRLKTLPPPGKAPYGYRRGQDRYIIDKSTAPVVKDFFERFILFGSLRGAVRYLEKRYGKKIAPSTGKNWLTNPVYRGDLQYKNHEIISNTHSAILDRESAAQIDRLLRRNSSLSTRTASAPRSLAGLVVCQQCQLAMTISHVTQKNKKQEYLYLRSSNCPRQPKCKALDYQTVLQQVIAKICQELPHAVATIEQPNFKQIKNSIERKIAEKRNILEQLETLLAQNILDEETANLRRYKIETEISTLENKIEQLPPENLKAIAKNVSFPQFWFDLSETERRFYFREFIKQIEIRPLANNTYDLQLIYIFGSV
jgi:DNA invertase Pin-like site-specific DNA recombinase